MAKCMRIPKGELSPRSDLVVYWCPACRDRHEVNVSKSSGLESPSWDWNGSQEAPTFAPSVHYSWRPTDPQRPSAICHHFVRNGQIEYCGDCTHAEATEDEATKWKTHQSRRSGGLVAPDKDTRRE